MNYHRERFRELTLAQSECFHDEVIRFLRFMRAAHSSLERLDSLVLQLKFTNIMAAFFDESLLMRIGPLAESILIYARLVFQRHLSL